ncbi:MAG: AAA family ATPase [Verrucomicrobiota bacterium]
MEATLNIVPLEGVNSIHPSVLSQSLAENISRVVVGKKEVINSAVVALLAGGHVLLEDVPGVGKTLLAKALAKSLAGDFKRIQFTADLLPSDVTGVTIYSQEQHDFHFRKGPVFSNVLLADEINRATPRTQSSLLEAMEELNVTVDGTVHQLVEPFFVIATQNPVELEGTYPLPFAQMDRFMCRLSIGYMNRAAEMLMLKSQRANDPLEAVEPVMDCETLVQVQKAVRRVKITDALLEYLVKIVEGTRTHEALEFGASPRGSLDLQAFSQGLALLEGRDYVLPDDIKHGARLVLPHRLIARRGNRSVTANARNLIDQIIQSVPVPI